jgi:hypothetical protein
MARPCRFEYGYVQIKFGRCGRERPRSGRSASVSAPPAATIGSSTCPHPCLHPLWCRRSRGVPGPPTGRVDSDKPGTDPGHLFSRDLARLLSPHHSEIHCGLAPRAFAGSACLRSDRRGLGCSTGHRQEFWIAARRWTMRAIEAGLLSVDCLKSSHTSVHAA